MRTRQNVNLKEFKTKIKIQIKIQFDLQNKNRNYSLNTKISSQISEINLCKDSKKQIFQDKKNKLGSYCENNNSLKVK